jgi:hypothetical protein
MANTVNSKRAGVAISTIDEDYDHGENISLHAIKFFPNNVAGGELVVYDMEESGLGIEICRLNSIDSEPCIDYFYGNVYRPYIDFSACTLNAGHKVIIVYDRTYF